MGKSVTLLTILFSLLYFSSVSAQAPPGLQDTKTKEKGKSGQVKENRGQGNDELPKGKRDVPREKMKENKDSLQVSQGQAFGKNKSGLSGREFGQARADSARKRQALNRMSSQLLSAKEKLNKAKALVEKQAKEKKISKEDLAEKEQKIREMEERLTVIQRRYDEDSAELK